MSPQIEAAGAVLWRAAGEALEVALVHRPRYDDWSLPKGKLDPGEHVLAAAVREVAEETGCDGALGRPLGELRYDDAGLPKRVRYWAMRAEGGTHLPTAEVDEVAWLSPPEALSRLRADHDRPVLERFLAGPLHTWPWVLVRHARAGDAATWKGDDRDRPLDVRGVRQAEQLATLLASYRPAQVVTADLLRCIETVAPLGRRCGLPVAVQSLLSERAWVGDRAAAVAYAVETADAGVPIVLCTQGGPAPAMAAALAAELGMHPPLLPGTRKGGALVVHLTRSEGRLQAVAVEPVDPPG